MKQKLAIFAALAVMVAMTGIAAANFIDSDGFTCKEGANGECLKAYFDISNTEIDAYAKTLDDDKCYQIRYYPPGTFDETNLYDDEAADNSGKVGPWPDDQNGFYTGPKFRGTEEPHFEIMNDPPVESWIEGLWNVALMHDGNWDGTRCQNTNTLLANSFKVSVGVDIPIPEFPTVAMPIAAILGLVFFFQSRKNKEE